MPAGVAAVILCGLAGALHPDLAIGDVVLDDTQNLVPGTVQMRRGTVHTAGNIVATSADKAALFKSTCADAVDMEQSIVRAWCDRLGLPLIGIRAISDTSAETLDPAVLAFVDDLGRPRPSKIAVSLLRRPGLVPQLMRLNASSKLALDKLAIALRRVVDVL